MRILIINGYSKDMAGQKRFSEFQYVIMKICAEQNELVDTETECYIRDKDNLDDFLYEMDSGFLRKEAALNFDQLDIIFICGDANVRPWSQSMRKIISILKMCIKVGKSCFACGFGMQGLIYLSASNMEKQINIINGKGNGGKLTEIKNLHCNMAEIKHSDYFLDNTTGDLYGFSYETSEWIPKGNVGIHQRKSAQEYQSIGKFVLKAPTYKANNQHEQNYKLFKQRHYEDTCLIKKMYLQHWALEGMDREFICPMKNSWDVHTFAFTNPEKVFNVLAESSERGPIIIIMKNIIGSMFPPDQKYTNTLKPIRNFIFYTLKKIKSQSNDKGVSIQTVTHLTQQTQVLDQLKQAKQKSRNKTLDLLNKRTTNMGFQHNKAKKNKDQIDNDKKNDIFRHVGYSAKKENVPEFYSQNNMRANKIKLDSAISQTSSKHQFTQQGGLKRSKFGDNEKKILKFADDQDIQNISDIENANLRPSTSQQASVFNPIPNINTKQKYNSPFGFGNLNHHGSSQQQIHYNIDPSQAKTLNKGAIRKMLHPQLSQEYIKSKNMWIPGNLSQQKDKKLLKEQEDMTLSQYTFHKTNYESKKDSMLTGLVKSNIWKGKFFSSFDQSIFTGPPQMTLEEMYKKQQLEQDKRIIGTKSIKVFSGHKDVNKELSNINKPFDASQKFINEIKFRDEKKERWMSKKDFLVI